MQYKRCPECGEMNRDEATACYQCGDDFSALESALSLPVGDPRLAAAQAATVSWDHSLGRLIQDSVDLYAKTFLPLLALIIGLTCVCFAYLLLSLALMFVSPWFFLILGPVGMVLACSFWSSHLVLLVDSVRGNARPLPNLLTVGLLRGIQLSFSLFLMASGLCVASFFLAVATRGVGLLLVTLLLFVVGILAYPFLPVLVLEGRDPVSAFFRSVELTENFRLNIFFLMLVNCAVAMLLQIGCGVIMQGSEIAMNMAGQTSLLALVPLTLGLLTAVITQVVIWSFGTVLAFVVFWKRTGGDKVGLFL